LTREIIREAPENLGHTKMPSRSWHCKQFATESCSNVQNIGFSAYRQLPKQFALSFSGLPDEQDQLAVQCRTVFDDDWSSLSIILNPPAS